MSISQQVEQQEIKRKLAILEDAILKLRNDLTGLQLEKSICQIEQRQNKKKAIGKAN